jgi:hypothetical protein
VQGAGRLSLKSKTAQKIAELSQVDDRRDGWLGGLTIQLVGCVYFAMRNRNQG